MFTAVQTWILAGAFFDALNERDCLGHAHRAPWIMTVFFEIQDEQHTVPFFRITWADRWPGRRDSIHEMVGLSDGGGGVAEMASSAQQIGFHCGTGAVRV